VTDGAGPARETAEPAERLSILALGTLTLDTVETPAGRRERAPGGSALYFAAAAGLLAPVRVMGVVGEDFPEDGLAALEERGAALDGVARVPGPTMSWHARYGPGLAARETVAADRGVLTRWEPGVPEAWRETPVVFLGSTDPGLQAAVLERARAPALVVADTMAHWIAERREEVEAVVARTDLFLASTEECRMLGNAPEILAAGPRWVVEKRGAEGAVLHGRGEGRAVPAFPVDRVVDPTGAGDAFAGGVVGWIAAEPGKAAPLRDTLSPGELGRALAAGAAAASFAVEGFSVEGMEATSRDDFLERMAKVESAGRD